MTNPNSGGRILPPPAVLRSLPPRMLANSIEKLCAAQGVSVSRFGRDTISDPRLVLDLHAGRVLRASTRDKVIDALAALADGKAVASC